MDNKYIVEFHKTSSAQVPIYYEYAFIINEIKNTIYKETSQWFDLYLEYFEDGYLVLEQDIDENKVEFISNILDNVSILGEHYDSYEQDYDLPLKKYNRADIKIKRTPKNSIYYYKDLNVFVGLVPRIASHGTTSAFSVFASSEQDIQNYLSYISKRLKDSNKNYITIYTDTSNGVQKKVEKITNTIDRDSVILDKNLKNEIFNSIDVFFNDDGEFFKKYNIPRKRGILLYGKPGNGKTTLVKSIANSVNVPVVYWQVTEYTSSETVNRIFNSVAAKVPAVLVIEDMDSIPSSVRSIFLNILDGVSSKEGLFIIGTTNYPEKVDEALMNRAGRFDKTYEIKKPDKELREIYLRRKKIEELINENDFKELIRLTEGYSMSILNELYTSIALQIYNDGKADIYQIVDSLNVNIKNQKKQTYYSEENKNIGFN